MSRGMAMLSTVSLTKSLKLKPFGRNWLLCVICQVSSVRCQVSHVTCHLSHVMDPPSANSPTIHRRIVYKDPKIILFFFAILYFWAKMENSKPFSFHHFFGLFFVIGPFLEGWVRLKQIYMQRWHNIQQTDIATYRLDWPSGRCSEKLKFLVYQPSTSSKKLVW